MINMIRKGRNTLIKLGKTVRKFVYEMVKATMPLGYTLIEINIEGRNYKFYTHYEGLQVIDEILLMGMYSKALSDDVCKVVDVGAHIGVFSVLIGEKIADQEGCFVISIEPMMINYRLLLNNIELNNLHRKIMPLRYAISYKKGYLDLEWIGNKERVPAITMHDVLNILRRYGHREIDLLKMDVEGAELEILTRNNSWLNSIKAIVMEVHPWIYGEQGLMAILHSLKEHGFEIRLIFKNIDSKTSMKLWLGSTNMIPSTTLLALWKSIVACFRYQHELMYVLALRQSIQT